MKRIARLAVIVVGLVALVAVIVSNLVPDDFIKNKIAGRIAELTGRDVLISGDPTLSVYPHLAISIGGLTIANREGMGEDPFIAADGVTTRLRLLPLLLGHIEVDAFELAKPRIRLVVDANGTANWHEANARLDAGLGEVTITDGTIIYRNLATDWQEELDAVDLDVAWPEATAAISAAGTVQWRGETVEFSGLIAEPQTLSAGDPSPARFAIGATSLRVLFNGHLVDRDGFHIDGEASVTTPSLRHTIAWLGTPMGTGSVLGAAAIKGTVDWSESTIAFSGASFELDGNAAEGKLTADFSGERLRLDGALAFTKLDLSPYAEATRAGLIADGPWLLAPTSLPIAEALDINLGVTAEEILIGGLHIDNVAVTATTMDGTAEINVREAQFYGGKLEARAVAAMAGEALSAKAEANVTAVPTGELLGDLAAIPVLAGTGSAVIDLGSEGRNWGEFAQAVAGTVTLDITDGSLAGVDVGALAAMSGDPLAELVGAATTTTDFARMSGNLTVGGGVLETDDLVAEGEGFRIAVSGWGSVLSGLIDGKARLLAAGDEIPLAISGTWWEPAFAVDRRRLQPDAGDAPPRG